ncbi:MAG: hypothetical protein ACQEUG_15495 [Pseudomonadota bacterium]
MSSIYLCAPFRSLLSINKRRVLSSYYEFSDLVNRVVSGLKNTDPALDFSQCSWGGRHIAPLYNTLEDDSSQGNFQPIISVEIMFSEIISRIPNPLISELSSWFLVESITCKIGLYDNTIGILELSADPCKSWSEFEERNARDLDDFTTRFCAFLVGEFSGVFDDMIERLLSQQGKKGFFFKKEQFVAFSDVSNYQGEGDNRLLWVGRTIYSGGGGEPCNFYNAWVNGYYSGGWSVNSGNNLVGDCFPWEDVVRSMVICQYFNAALTILNMNLDEVNVLEDGFDKDYKKITLMKRQVELFDIDEMGVKNGLQGKRRELCSLVFSAWNHDELKELVRKRLALIGSRLQEVNSRKIRRYSSVMEALLAFIGAVTLVDVCLSMFVFTNVEYREGRPWSVLEMIRNVEPDFLVSFLVLVSILFGIFYVRKQRN